LRANIGAKAAASEFTFDACFAQLESFVADKIVIADTSLSLFAAADLPLSQQSAFIAQSTWMSIGYSVGAAVGASCATRKRVVAFVGDCGFRQSPQALSTLSEYELPAIVFVISNKLLGIQQFLTGPDFYKEARGAPDYFNVLTQWDYCSLARSFGVQGFRVAKADELASIIEHVEKNPNQPYLVELVLSDRDLPRAVRDVLQHPVSRVVQDDLEYPLLGRQAFDVDRKGGSG
jgi:indolepyruvate decarboxylase